MASSSAVSQVGKHQLPVYVTPPEARRFEALAREYYGVKPAQLLRLLLFQELRETQHLELSQPHPDTVPGTSTITPCPT